MRRRGDAGPEKLLAITSGDVETSYRLLWAGVVLLTMALCFVGGVSERPELSCCFTIEDNF